MFSFLKKIIANLNGKSDTSSLMERATNSAIMDQTGRSSYFLSEGSSHTPHTHNVHDDVEEMWLHQEMLDSHDPYLNPGQDGVIDENYHGMDHGFHDGDHHHDY